MIELQHLPLELRSEETAEYESGRAMSLAAMERFLVEQALQRHDGNRKRAAQELGVDVSTLYRKVKRLGVAPPARDGRSRRGA